MRRRQFIAGLGSTATWPVVARAQQQSIPVVGYLGDQSADDDFTVPFLQGLKQAGYVEGQNVAVEYRLVGGSSASGGDGGTRDFIVAVDAATGKLVWRKYVIPAPGEPGSETWKDKNLATIFIPTAWSRGTPIAGR
jgi:hypothetical protein